MASPGVFRIELDENTCSLCEVCVTHCPPRALGSVKKDLWQDLFFDDGLCNGCGGKPICQEVCPEKSILRVTPTDGPALRRPVSLMRGPLAQCRKCGSPFASQRKIATVLSKPSLEARDVHDYCPDCRRAMLLDSYRRSVESKG